MPNLERVWHVSETSRPLHPTDSEERERQWVETSRRTWAAVWRSRDCGQELGSSFPGKGKTTEEFKQEKDLIQDTF